MTKCQDSAGLDFTKTTGIELAGKQLVHLGQRALPVTLTVENGTITFRRSGKQFTGKAGRFFGQRLEEGDRAAGTEEMRQVEIGPVRLTVQL